MIASSRSSSRSSMFTSRSCFICLAHPGHHPEHVRERAHLAHLAHLREEVLERELLAGGSCARAPRPASASETSSAFSISDSTSPMPRIRARHPLGVEALELLELLAGRRVEDRLAGHRPHRQRRAAAGVAVELRQHARRRTRPARRSSRRRSPRPGRSSRRAPAACRAAWSRLRIATSSSISSVVDVQAPGGVDDQHVVARRLAPGPAPTRRSRPGSRSVPCS